MTQTGYRVGDLKRIIQESAQEFDAKLGPGVKEDNKKNNDKSYKDAQKAGHDYDGGLTDSKKKNDLPGKLDGNRTTLDYNPRTEPTQDYKDKVEAQAQGYTSVLEKKNSIEKAAQFDNDGKIMKQFKDASNDINKGRKALEDSGIQGNNLKDLNPDKNTLYENMTPKAKRLKFKHTKFLNESQMLSRIPDEYKKDGQRIYMQDAYDNEYIVECSKSEKTGLIETNVISYKNDTVLNEQVSRIQELFDYKSSHDFAPRSNAERINENKDFQDIMDLARGKKK